MDSEINLLPKLYIKRGVNIDPIDDAPYIKYTYKNI